MSGPVRINRFLASAGLGSRRSCEELIRHGRVTVNGRAVEGLGDTVDPERDLVTVDGTRVEIGESTVVLVLNKPTGVLSTVEDTHGRATVIDIAREAGWTARVFPVGRLDKETSGVILLTNDGELTHRLTHPRYKVEKTYRVVVEGDINDESVASVAAGVRTRELVTMPCRVTVISRGGGESELEVTISEGKKRQVRRMFAAVGHAVKRLHRSTIADLAFEDVASGAIRPLTAEEEKKLRDLTGLR
ncbi:MAG: rRNA pseudouridine synthase [Candidatus Krumholzibacteriota bacterium]|nr:rRNA pseudouridine synthase [Candidatus Krumholzibacteriota bacterium]